MSKKKNIFEYADTLRSTLLGKNIFNPDSKYSVGVSRQISDDETKPYGKEGDGENVGSVSSDNPTNCGDIPMRRYLRGKNSHTIDNQYGVSSISDTVE